MTLEPESLNGVVAHLEELQASDGHSRTAASLAEAYRLQGRLDDAARVAREAAGAMPRNAAVRIVLARALRDAGDAEGSAAAYREVLTIDPANLEATAATQAPPEEEPSEVRLEPEPELTRPGTLSEELAHLSELFVEPRRGPGGAQAGDGIATLTLAEIYARQGLLERAAGICQMLIERDPEDADARERLSSYRREIAQRREQNGSST